MGAKFKRFFERSIARRRAKNRSFNLTCQHRRDGAENSTMMISKGADYESLRVSAAMKGALGDQKAVLVFQRSKDGEARLYSGHVEGKIDDIHTGLLAAGVENHSLAPTETGAKVFIADLSGDQRGAVSDYTKSQGAKFSESRGTGEFIGAADHTGSEANQRAQGQAA